MEENNKKRQIKIDGNDGDDGNDSGDHHRTSSNSIICYLEDIEKLIEKYEALFQPTNCSKTYQHCHQV